MDLDPYTLDTIAGRVAVFGQFDREALLGHHRSVFSLEGAHKLEVLAEAEVVHVIDIYRVTGPIQ
jgi:hypothetical protein